MRKLTSGEPRWSTAPAISSSVPTRLAGSCWRMRLSRSARDSPGR